MTYLVRLEPTEFDYAGSSFIIRVTVISAVLWVEAANEAVTSPGWRRRGACVRVAAQGFLVQ